MELTLPTNYVELEQEEMMYLDGGWRDWIVKGLGVAISGFAAGDISTWASNLQIYIASLGLVIKL